MNNSEAREISLKINQGHFFQMFIIVFAIGVNYALNVSDIKRVKDEIEALKDSQSKLLVQITQTKEAFTEKASEIGAGFVKELRESIDRLKSEINTDRYYAHQAKKDFELIEARFAMQKEQDHRFQSEIKEVKEKLRMLESRN